MAIAAFKNRRSAILYNIIAWTTWAAGNRVRFVGCYSLTISGVSGIKLNTIQKSLERLKQN